MVLLLFIITVLITFTTSSHAATWPAANCSISAIQDAIDLADNGDTVTLPSCVQTIWTSTVNITKRITLKGAGVGNTIIRRSEVSANHPSTNPMFHASGVTGFEMSDMTLNGTNDTLPNEWRDGGLLLTSCIDFKIHHMNFTFFGNALVVMGDPTLVKGVIYENTFTDNYFNQIGGVGGLGYGVYVHGNGTYPALSLGTLTNTFIENNTFTRSRHSIASSNGARYVFRYNTIVDNREDAAAVDAHGYSSWPRGTRQYEIYHNKITNSVVRFSGIRPRGGDGVIFNNEMSPMSSNRDISLTVEDSGVGVGCTGGYPQMDQIRVLHIWGNKRLDGSDAFVLVDTACRDGNLTLNTDYFLTPRTGYAPVIHPHPLREVVPPDTITGLIARYGMDQTTGTTATDSSGNNRHAALNGTYTWVPGIVGTNALQFDGTTGFGQITGLMGTPAALTLAAHVQLLPGETTGDVISLGNYAMMRVQPTFLSAHYWNGSAFTVIQYPLTFGTGWRHIAYTFGGGLHKLYLDGVEVQSGSASAIGWTGQGTNTFIGTHGNGQTTQFLAAKLDEVRVYSGVLSATDIAALVAESPSPPTVSISSPTPTGSFATNNDTVSLSGSASDNVSVASVTVNCPQCNPALTNSPAVITGSTWAKNNIVLGTAPSTNNFVVTATDNQGSQATASLSVTYTLIPPTGGLECTRWASNNGTGDGLTLNTPYTIAQFWPQVASAKVLCLRDGVYTGPNNMITPTTNIKGTSSQPITIRTINEGQVTIDGQFARNPVVLLGGAGSNDYIHIEGVNARNGLSGVFRVFGNNNKLSRVIGWDIATATVDGVIFLNEGIGNIIEDCAGWGKNARWVMKGSGVASSTGSGYRRCWCEWQGHVNESTVPGTCFQPGVGQILENVLGTLRETTP